MAIIDVRRSGLISNPDGFKPLGKVIGIALHHSVTTMKPSASEAEERAHIKVIDQYHASLEWGGFGYHAAAFPSGRAYLCGDGQRAHVKGRNHELIGIVGIGDFSGTTPGIDQINAIKELIAAFGTALPLKGHQDWALPGEGTACPGTLAKLDWSQPGPVQPPLPPLPLPEAFKQAHIWLGARYITGTLRELDPYDVGIIQSVLDRWRAERQV